MAAANLRHIAAILIILRRRRKRRHKAANRELWCRPWILRRPIYGSYHSLLREFEEEDIFSFRNYVRMLPNNFNYICQLIEPKVRKENTGMRRAISVGERLAITLRFLASGETFRSLSYSFRVGERTISGIVQEVCTALYEVLKDRYLKTPNSEKEWKQVAEGFQRRWNYPFCMGALDGKHISIQAPANSGSTYFNYKHFFSTILLAVVDANYRFLYVDVGAPGRCGDAGVFEESSLKQAMNLNQLKFPDPEKLPGTDNYCNYHFIADDAFPLRCDLLKPYPHKSDEKEKQIFNYRFSRARRVVENAFGILAKRFNIFLKRIPLQPEFVDKLVLAACCLQNFLIEHQSQFFLGQNLVDSENNMHELTPGTWRNGEQLIDLQPTSSKNSRLNAKGQRDLLKKYFNSEAGAVPWQEYMIN